MMDVWAKTEAREAENSSSERLCWFIDADGSSGVTIAKLTDKAAASALLLATGSALGEFIEIESEVMLDPDAAMPSTGTMSSSGLCSPHPEPLI